MVLDRAKPTRTAAPTMPEYPGARDTQLEPFAIVNVGTGYIRRFSTADAPAQVESFYERELTASGWRKVAANNYEETRACPYYKALLETERVAEGITRMRLTWQPEECKKI